MEAENEEHADAISTAAEDTINNKHERAAAEMVSFLIEARKNNVAIAPMLSNVLNSIAHKIVMTQRKGDEVSFSSMKRSRPQKCHHIMQAHSGTSVQTTQRIVRQASSIINESTIDRPGFVADEIDKKVAAKVSAQPLVTYGKGRPLLARHRSRLLLTY